MKIIQVKKYISKFFLGTAVVICIILASAICGVLSNNRGNINQNILGGYGTVETANRSRTFIMPFMYDYANIYYWAQNKESGETELYSYNTETGVNQTVCQRVLCEHDTDDCLLNHLYHDTGSMNYYAIDDKMYYTINNYDNNSSNGIENIVLYEWNLMSDERKVVYEFPGAFVLKDEEGTEVEVVSAVHHVERINKNTVLVHCGNTAYLFDDNFLLLDSFECPSGTYIAWTEQTIFWGEGLDFACYDIESNSIEEKIIEKYSEGTAITPSSDKWYGYEDFLYFTSNNMIMAYSTKDKSLTEITEISRPGNEEFIQPYQFVIFDNLLYYYFEEAVFRIDLDTGEKRQMPDMHSIPLAKTDKYLVLNWPQLELYDFDGRRVN